MKFPVRLASVAERQSTRQYAMQAPNASFQQRIRAADQLSTAKYRAPTAAVVWQLRLPDAPAV